MRSTRRPVALAAALLLAGCGLIEPSEGQMAGAFRRYMRPAYGTGAEVEYLRKSLCTRKFSPMGYFCRFQLTTNTKLAPANEGFFYYRSGWQVKDLAFDPKYPS